MSDTSFLDWPFFDDRAPRAGARARRLGRRSTSPQAHEHDVDAACRALVRAARRGRLAARTRSAARAYGGAADAIDTRAICLIRETLARHDGLADFAFAMQGLGSGAISLAGTRRAEGALPAARGARRGDRGLRAVRARGRLRRGGDAVRARAPTATTTCSTARRPGSPTAASPTSTSSSRAPAKRPGARGISRLHRRCRHAGLRDRRAHRRDRAAPAGAAALRRLPRPGRRSASARAGEGFKVAMRTLDVFRTSVAAAALGFARRALDESAAARHARAACSAQTLADFQLTQAKLAQMATDDRQRRAAHLPRRLAARPGPPRHARGGDGQDGRHRRRAAGHRRGGADVRRPRRRQRAAGRAAVPRDPRAAHLRGRDRGAAAHHRARAAARGRTRTDRSHGACHDQRSHRHLRARPPAAAGAVAASSCSSCPSCSFPSSSTAPPNCSTAHVRRGPRRARVCIRAPAACAGPTPTCRTRANRIASVLVQRHGPGARQPRAAARAQQPDAGGLLVRGDARPAASRSRRCRCCAPRSCGRSSTRPQVTHALCDARAGRRAAQAARRAAPVLRAGRAASTATAPTASRRRWRASAPASTTSTPPPTTPALIAFTSGTTGAAEGDDALPPRRDGDLRTAGRRTCCGRSADDVFIGSPPLAFTFGLGGLLLFPMRVGASTRAAREGRARRSCSRRIQRLRRDRAVHRADLLPRDGRARRTSCARTASCASACRPARRCRRRRARCGRRRPASS